MQVKTDPSIHTLNVLIDACKNGEKGFREAAESLQNPYYQIKLNEYARVRARFALELQGLVHKLGGEPDRKGTFAGTLHRGWMNIKAAALHGKDEAVLAECCRGEEAALKHYEEAFHAEMPEAVLDCLRQQCSEMKETLKHLRALV